MSFWQDASPIVKGAIVIGALLLVYLGIARVAGLIPFSNATGEEMQQTRGLPPPP